jgi:hypothetical protein
MRKILLSLLFAPAGARIFKQGGNAIRVDPKHGAFWGASGNHGEDHGIGW